MINIVTRHDNDSVCIRAIVHQMLEQGIRFKGWEEQKLPSEIPSDFESYSALIVDEEILRDTDADLRRRLCAYAAQKHVYVIGKRLFDPALARSEIEGYIAVEMNVLQAASGLQKEKFPALSEQVIIDGFMKRAEEYFTSVPEFKFFNEYHLHFLMACMALEGSPLAPLQWTERINSAMETMFKHESIIGDHDQVAAWMLAPLCFKRTGVRRPTEFLLHFCDEIIQRRPRTPDGLLSPGGFTDDPLCFSQIDDGSFSRNQFTIVRRNLVLNEQLHYLGGTFAAATAVSHDDKYFSEVMAILRHIEKVHRDPADGLLFHASLRGEIVGEKWGRGNTHALLGAFYMLRTYPDMPQNAKDEIIAFLDRSGQALKKVQAESGLWHNVLNKPETPEETSCSVLITYLYSHLVNNGLLPYEFYAPMLMRSRDAIMRKFWRGYGSGNCVGTLPAYQNPNYYTCRGQHIWPMPLIAGALVESGRILERKA